MNSKAREKGGFLTVMRKYQIRKIIFMCAGVLLMSISISLFCESSLGTDPYTCLNLGLSQLTGIPYSMVQLCISGAVFMLEFSFSKHLLGIGTVVYFVSTGFLVDLIRPGLRFLFCAETLEQRISFLLLGILFLGIGASFFFTANLGVSPYDAVGFILTQKTHIGYRWCHIATDLICALAGLLLGAQVGIGTLIASIFMGPLVQLFNKKLTVPLLNRGMWI